VTTNLNYLLYQKDEPIQQRYAVVIFLPAHVDETVFPLREKYDPLYDHVDSHITLVFPFETRRSLDDLAGAIRRETVLQPTLSIELTTVGDYYPDYPVIFWKAKPTKEICDLYTRLYGALELPVPYKDFQPHVTVAREISHHRLVFVKDRIASYLRHERCEATHLDLIAPMVGNRWVSVRRFALVSPAGDS
jgi:2'-5' RNA ligase